LESQRFARFRGAEARQGGAGCLNEPSSGVRHSASPSPIVYQLLISVNIEYDRRKEHETAEEAAKAALSGAKPLSQNGYKVQLARVAVKRALLEAVRA
jgi:hypothetical protein